MACSICAMSGTSARAPTTDESGRLYASRHGPARPSASLYAAIACRIRPTSMPWYGASGAACCSAAARYFSSCTSDPSGTALSVASARLYMCPQSVSSLGYTSKLGVQKLRSSALPLQRNTASWNVPPLVDMSVCRPGSISQSPPASSASGYSRSVGAALWYRPSAPAASCSASSLGSQYAANADLAIGAPWLPRGGCGAEPSLRLFEGGEPISAAVSSRVRVPVSRPERRGGSAFSLPVETNLMLRRSCLFPLPIAPTL
mmetsp:Transcript_17320/g.59226  ORF Transcript_17320/g.59226 Transcript_17320/m.59226 type:complete len:260 (-) Transcript_17320:12-791(-)